MSRALTALAAAEVVKQDVAPVVFCELEFDSGTLHLWSGLGTIDWDGDTYTGAGNVMDLTPVEETVEVRAAGVELTLSALPAATVALALLDARQGNKGRFWLGFLDSTGAIIADPYPVFVGLLDVPSMNEQGDTADLKISYENRLIGLLKANDRRYTPEDQHVDHPGDTGFDFVAGLQDASIVW